MSTTEYPAPRLDGPRLPRLREAAAATSIPAEVWLAGAIVVIAAVIRIITIDNQSIWMDEALTAYEAGLPFGAMIHTVATVEATPPLYFVLVWLSVHIFGHSDAAVRLVSALAGIGMVPVAYLAARELVDSRRAGLIAALLTAVSPFMVWYSQEARAYMLAGTLAGASFLWFVRTLRDPSRRNIAGWAIFSSLALMTHFFAVFVVGPEALWLAYRHRTRLMALGIGAVVAVQVAMTPLAFFDSGHGAGWIAASSPRIDRLGEVPLELGLSTLYRDYARMQGLIGGAVFLLVIVLLLAIGGDRRTRRGAGIAATIGLGGMLLPLLLGFVGPDYFLSRNLMPMWLPVIVLVAAVCVLPRARLTGAVFAVSLLAIFAATTIDVQTTPALQRPDFRLLAQAIGGSPVPRAVLAPSGLSSDPLKIYLPHVAWVEQPTASRTIDEIVVIGARRREPVLPWHARSRTLPDGLPVPVRFGVAAPREEAPPGSTLVGRARVEDWTIARFRLDHPMRLNIDQLQSLALRYYGRTPNSLLVMLQGAGR